MKNYSIMIFLAYIATPNCAAEPVKAIPIAQKVLSSENGRFVFGQVSEYRRDQFMLDTKTGKIWQIVYAPYKNADGTNKPGDGYAMLTPVVYEDINGIRAVEPK